MKILKNRKAFIDYSQTTEDVYENLEDYSPTKKRKALIVFNDMIADMESNKKLSPKVIEWFLGGRELNISLVFRSQYYFKVPKIIRLNATHYFIITCSIITLSLLLQKRTSTNSMKPLI